MKKICCTLLLLVFLTSCSQEKEVKNMTWDDISVENPELSQTASETQADMPDFPSLDGIPVDIDITKLGGSMAFSQVQLMMYVPQEYWGKTFRIHGVYHPVDSPEFGLAHVLLMMDDTLCCQGYLEFQLAPGSTYPEAGAPIGLVGTYTLVEDGIGGFSLLLVSDFAY